ncbi:hypothetical protein Q5P01_002260 [Channa striata]|uniref:Uncharacterized protein n=1 Tax=Channa striata TaxID=64152 RepID=A0AA88T4N2_CHASR|nr:hypothetical protein Q5P01_002260 [Channa striata]
MSRVIGFLLLLVILVNIYESTASSSTLPVTSAHVPMCKCRVTTKGKIKCPAKALPKTYKEKIDLIKCLCSKIDKLSFSKLHGKCKSKHIVNPIPMV